MLSKLIETRLRVLLDGNQPTEQAGFRKGYSTVDHLQSINLVIEKCSEYDIELHAAFIDYSKAFDSINHKFLLSALKNQNVPQSMLNLIREMYTNVKARVVTDVKGSYFNIEKGVKQGDPLSPILFNTALEEVFRKLEWENKGILINGKKLSNLRFADDIVIFSTNIKELEGMLNELNELGKPAGLRINFEKTKILSKDIEHAVHLEGTELEKVGEVIYLGQLISIRNEKWKEVDRRVGVAWKKYWSLKAIFKGPYGNKQKCQIFNSCVLPALSYGSQTWSLTRKIEKKLNVTQNTFGHSILNIKKIDKIEIKKINTKLKFRLDILHQIKRQKWNWGGHIARMDGERWAYKTTFWQILKKRKKGRPATRWVDDINRFLRNKWFHRVAQDRSEWYRLREAYAQSQGLERD